MASPTREPMKALFEELVKDGAPAARGLLGRVENVDFDCKRKADPTLGGAGKGDKEVLGRALSALANSMGGLLLWGVDAREDPKTKIDAVCGFEPIADIGQFKSEMARLAIEALMPRLSVRVESIPDPGFAGGGFLAMYVERSERRPTSLPIWGKAILPPSRVIIESDGAFRDRGCISSTKCGRA